MASFYTPPPDWVKDNPLNNPWIDGELTAVHVEFGADEWSTWGEGLRLENLQAKAFSAIDNKFPDADLSPDLKKEIIISDQWVEPIIIAKAIETDGFKHLKATIPTKVLFADKPAPAEEETSKPKSTMETMAEATNEKKEAQAAAIEAAVMNDPKNKAMITPAWVFADEPQQAYSKTKDEYSIRVRLKVKKIKDKDHQAELNKEAVYAAWDLLLDWQFPDKYEAEWIEKTKAVDKTMIETKSSVKEVWIDTAFPYVYFLVVVQGEAIGTIVDKMDAVKTPQDTRGTYIIDLLAEDIKTVWEEKVAIVLVDLEKHNKKTSSGLSNNNPDWKSIANRYRKAFHNLAWETENLWDAAPREYLSSLTSEEQESLAAALMDDPTQSVPGLGKKYRGLQIHISPEYEVMAARRLPTNKVTTGDGTLEVHPGIEGSFDKVTAGLLVNTFAIADDTPDQHPADFAAKYVHPFGYGRDAVTKADFEAMEKARLGHNREVSKIQSKLATKAFHGILADATHRGYMSPELQKDILDTQKDLVSFVGDAKVESPEEMCTPLKDIKKIYKMMERFDLAAQARRKTGKSDLTLLWEFLKAEYNSAKGDAKAAAKKNLDDFNAARKLYEKNINAGLHAITVFKFPGAKNPSTNLLMGITAIATAALMIMIKKAIVKEIKEKCKAIQGVFDELKCAALDNEFMTDTRKNMKKYGLFSMRSEELAYLHEKRDWKTQGPSPGQDALRVSLRQPLDSKKARKIRQITGEALQDLTPPQVCGMLARDEVPPAVYETIKTHIENDPELKGIFRAEDFPKVLNALKADIKYSPPITPPIRPVWCEVEPESLGAALAGRAPADLIEELEAEQRELHSQSQRKLLREVFNLPPEDLESPEAIANALIQNAINQDEQLGKTTTKFIDNTFDTLDTNYAFEAQELRAKLMKLTEKDPSTIVITKSTLPDGGILSLETSKTYLEGMKDSLEYVANNSVEASIQNIGITAQSPQGYTLQFNSNESGLGFNIKISAKGTVNGEQQDITLFEKNDKVEENSTAAHETFFHAADDRLVEIFGYKDGALSELISSKKMFAGILRGTFTNCVAKLADSPLFEPNEAHENLKDLTLVHENPQNNLFSADDIKEEVKKEVKELMVDLPMNDATMKAVLNGTVDALARLTVAEVAFLNIFFLSVYPSLETDAGSIFHSFLRNNLKWRLANRPTEATIDELLEEAMESLKTPLGKLFPTQKLLEIDKSFEHVKLETLEERDVPRSYFDSNQTFDFEKYKQGGLILERYARISPNHSSNFAKELLQQQTNLVNLVKEDNFQRPKSTSLDSTLDVAGEAMSNLIGVVNIQAWQDTIAQAINSPLKTTSDGVLYFREIEFKHYKDNVWKKVEGPIWMRDPAAAGQVFDKFTGGTYYFDDKSEYEGSFNKFFDIKEHGHYWKDGKMDMVFTGNAKAAKAASTGVDPEASGMHPSPIKTLTFNVEAQEEDFAPHGPESQVRFHWHIKQGATLVTQVLKSAPIAGMFDPWLYGLRLSYVLPTDKTGNNEMFLKTKIVKSADAEVKEDMVRELVKEGTLVYQSRQDKDSKPRPFYVIPLVSVEYKPKAPYKTLPAPAKEFVSDYHLVKEKLLYKMLAEKAKNILSITSDPMMSLTSIYSTMFVAHKLGVHARKSFGKTSDIALAIYDAIDKVDDFNHETTMQKDAKKKKRKQLLEGEK